MNGGAQHNDATDSIGARHERSVQNSGYVFDNLYAKEQTENKNV
jgi:hypothetical protein